MRVAHALLAGALAACASAPPESAPAPVASGAAISDGCPGIVATFLTKPDSTPVTRVPEVIKMDPAPFRRPFPSDLLKKGKAEFQATVLIDTLGVPQMYTYKVIKTTHPWLTNSALNAIVKWKFRPAEINGCKVPRSYLLSGSWGT